MIWITNGNADMIQESVLQNIDYLSSDNYELVSGFLPVIRYINSQYLLGILIRQVFV